MPLSVLIGSRVSPVSSYQSRPPVASLRMMPSVIFSLFSQVDPPAGSLAGPVGFCWVGVEEKEGHHRADDRDPNEAGFKAGIRPGACSSGGRRFLLSSWSDIRVI